MMSGRRGLLITGGIVGLLILIGIILRALAQAHEVSVVDIYQADEDEVQA